MRARKFPCPSLAGYFRLQVEYNHCFFLTFQCNLFPKNQQQTERFLLPWAGLFKAGLCISRSPFDRLLASVNSTCSQRARADPRALAFFLPWMANSREWGLLSCQIPRGGDEKRGQMPRPPSTLQHFSLIAQSNSAILSILMCDFLFQLTSSFVIALGF